MNISRHLIFFCVIAYANCLGGFVQQSPPSENVADGCELNSRLATNSPFGSTSFSNSDGLG